MITFLVPTFNEKQNIFIFIDTINNLKLNFDYEILFVDDNSDDGTYDELVRAKNFYGNVNFFIRKEKKRDLTQSIVFAISKLKSKYTFILDCDLQHDYKKIQLCVDEIENNNMDLVIGSRFIRNGQNIVMSKKRIIESKLAILISKLLGINKIKDPMSGFFVIKTNLLSKIKNKITTRGFKILLTIIFLNKKFLSFKEIPIKFNERKFGKSKLNFRVRLLFIEQILRLVFKI